MQTYFPGHIQLPNLRAELEALFALLEAHGVEVVANVEISFQAWNTEAGRAQIWGEDGRIQRLVFEQAPQPKSSREARTPAAGLELRFRSHDEPFNPIALMFGHDD